LITSGVYILGELLFFSTGFFSFFEYNFHNGKPLHGYACTGTPARVRLHGYACTGTPARVRLHGYACTGTPARVRLAWNFPQQIFFM
jgi:hypothetical protein